MMLKLNNRTRVKAILQNQSSNHIKTFVLIVLLFLPFFLEASTNFYAIDRHADDAPEKLKNSAPALVDYLVRPAKNEQERVRAIFRWITQNIDYDADAFINQRIIADEPLHVLNRGKAVCGGYANLSQTRLTATASSTILIWMPSEHD